MMTGEVKLKRQKSKTPPHSFADLVVGEGIESNHEDGIRIKAGHSSYLHFQNSGVVVCNEVGYWPQSELYGTVRKFRLIAEEI